MDLPRIAGLRVELQSAYNWQRRVNVSNHNALRPSLANDYNGHDLLVERSEGTDERPRSRARWLTDLSGQRAQR
jgi:hypothetical protein